MCSLVGMCLLLEKGSKCAVLGDRYEGLQALDRDHELSLAEKLMCKEIEEVPLETLATQSDVGEVTGPNPASDAQEQLDRDLRKIRVLLRINGAHDRRYTYGSVWSVFGSLGKRVINISVGCRCQPRAGRARAMRS